MPISQLHRLTLCAAAQLSLTTEYTPISRGGPPQPSATVTPQLQPQLQQDVTPTTAAPAPAPARALSQVPNEQPNAVPDDGVDTSTLPPAIAPPSAPAVDPTAVGVYDGHSIFEHDIGAMAEKPWRRPGSDISDWFNYGFDELSWEAYCVRRRELGELANVLKTNVIVRMFSIPCST